MIKILIGAVTIVGSFFSRFLQDYISEIIVHAILFPIEVLKETKVAYNKILKPITITF